MSIDAHLIHRCDVVRAVGGRTGYEERDETFHTHIQNLACRLVVRDKRYQNTPAAEAVLVTDYLLLLPANVDVQEADRISEVRLEDGTVLGGPFRIESVQPRRARTQRHLALRLMEVA